jgi:thioredoxin 1
MVFRDSILVFRQPGALPPHVFEQLIEQVRKLDMDEVRKEIAAREAAAEGPATDEA